MYNRAVRVFRQANRQLPVLARQFPQAAPQLRLATPTLPSLVPGLNTAQPFQTAVPHVPAVAIPRPSLQVPNVFHTRIAPVTFKPAQNQAARFVERAVARVPGRARPPRFPQLAHYNRPQRAYITSRTQQYGQQAARDRGFASVKAAARQGVNLGQQIGRYGEPQARAAVRAYTQTLPRQQARESVHPGGPVDVRGRRMGDVGPSPAAAILSGGIHPVAGMTLTDVAHAVNKGFVAPSVKGTLDLAANAPGAIYNTAAAGFEALHGDPGRAQRLVHDFVNNDPVALLVQGRTKEFSRAVARNPVAFTLEVLGGKAAVGRTVGRVQRAAGVSQEAAPAVLEGTSVVQRRPYSKDAIVRKRQIAQDRGRLAVARHFAQQAGQAELAGALDTAKQYRAKARQWSPHHVTDFQVHRRVDERVHANEMVRRAMRGLAMNRAQKHVVSRRKGGAIMSLLAQGIVHPHHGDIQGYLAELDQRFHSGQLTKAQAFANRNTATEVRAALGSKHLNLPQLHARAKAFAVEQAAVEGHLVRSGLLDGAQAEKARLIPYAVRRMGASHNGERIIGPDGRFLSSQAIKQHMLANGVNPDHVGYLSQAPNARGARNFYMNTLQRHVIPDLRRTGEATRNGTFDTHPQTFIEQAAREANLLAADHGFKGLIGEFALRHDAGHPDAGAVRQFGSKRSAQLWIDDQHAQGARPLRAVRMNPFLGKQKDLEHVLEAVNSNREVPASLLDQVHAAVDHSADGPGPWTVIHDTAAHRLQQHLSLQRPIPGLRGMQKVNQAFRNAVLPLSTRWITGNVVEAGFRTALAGAGPVSYLTGRAAFKRLDQLHAEGKITEQQMLEARARTVGGGHFAMAEQTSVHSGAQQYEHSVLRPVAHALGAVAKAPVARNVGNLWGHYTHFVFSANGAMERQFQTALAGKYLRDMKPSRGELALSRKAVEQAAQGLTNTNEQVAMGRFIDRAYGKYGKFNPTERALIAYYTPFIAWSLNAVKFVGSVLPKDHPVATGLLVAAQNASGQWLKDHGLNLWMKNAAPGWLQGSVPVAGGGKVRAGRYLPFGFFGDPAQNTASTLMPQYASAFLALNGLDWKGQSLTGPGGGTPDQGKKFGSALEAFLGGTVPILGQVQQVVTKKGPLGQRLQRQFNPFYPVQPTASGGSGGGRFDQQIDKALKNPPSPLLGGGKGGGRRPSGGGGNVFGRIVSPDILMAQGVQRAGLKTLAAASNVPDVKRHNVNVIRRGQRENPQYARNAAALFNRVRTTRDLPKWARGLPNPKVVFARNAVNANPRSKGFGQLVPGVYPGAAWAPWGQHKIVVSPQGVHGAFAGKHQNYYRQIPLHELAHTLQRLNLGHTLTEGGAEAFKRLAAHDIGLPPATTAKAYRGFTKRAQRRGDRYVSRGQFNPAIGQANAKLTQLQRRRLAKAPALAAGTLKGAGTVIVKQRLFAHPQRPGAGKAGQAQLKQPFGQLRKTNPTLRTGRLTPHVRKLILSDPKAAKLRKRGYSNQQIINIARYGKSHAPPDPFVRKANQLIVAGAKGIVKGVKPSFAPGSQKATVYAAARKYGVPPRVLWGVYGAETNFGKNNNVSSAGAQGPFQFMPGTARTLGVNPHNFKSAAYGAAKYLRSLYHGDWHAAVGHYNSGPAGNLTNSQTAAYIPEVFRLAQSLGKGQKLTRAQSRAFKILAKGRRPGVPAMPSPLNTSGVTSSVSSPGVSGPTTAGKASAGKASALSALPATDVQALADLLAPKQGPVLATPLTAPAFSAGAVFPSGYTAGSVSLADILQRLTGRRVA